MAKKEFTFRGLTLDQVKGMGIKEFAQLITSRERRSLLRGLSNEEKSLLRKLEKRDKVKTQAREMVVVPQMIGKTIMLHKGNAYEPIQVTEDMLGHRLGEFLMTRKIAKHAVTASKKKEVTRK